MLGSSDSRVPKILSPITYKPNKMNSNFYLNKAKECFKNSNFPDAYENFVNYFDCLEDPANSTPAVQLGFTKLVCRIGLVLEDANDTDELLKIYLQAINFFPNNYIILNNLGGYLFKMGQIDIARTYLDKAVACSKSYLPAEKNLMHCKWRQIPRWHFKMLNDNRRNIAYQQAIRNVIDKGYKDVVDVGAGCGLLSLLASESPDVNVTAIEDNKVLAKMFENIMKENLRENVKIVNCYSTKLTQPVARCNLLVTEIFDCALFGEKMLTILVHAKSVLVTEKHDFKIVPCAARLYAAGLNYEDTQSFRVVNRIPVLNLDTMCIRQNDPEPYEAENLASKKVKYLTEPVKLFDLNFYEIDMDNMELSKSFEFECIDDGSFTSIAVWFELDLDECTTITTDPRNPERIHCWEQALFHLDHPMNITKGDLVQFHASVIKNQLKFKQVTLKKSCNDCWFVSKEIVSFLNDYHLVAELLYLAKEMLQPAFAQRFSDPHKPLMDLMPFPLLGFMLARIQGCKFFATVSSVEIESTSIDFFDHILKSNEIPQGKLTVIESKTSHNAGLCGIQTYLESCKACLIDPINTDGSIQSTVGLKEKLSATHPEILMLPTKIVLKVLLIYSDQLENWNIVYDRNVFDYKISQFMNEYTGYEHPDLEADFIYQEYSKPISFTIDDKDYVKKTQNISIIETGHINAFYTWYEMQFFDNILITTRGSSHIKKTCYLLHHRRVVRGEKFKVVMRRESTHLDLRLDD